MILVESTGSSEGALKQWQCESSMMCEIYERARSVTLWLGPPRAKGEIGIERMKSLYGSLELLDIERRLEGLGRMAAQSRSAQLEGLLYNGSQRPRFDFAVVTDLFQRNWWHRIWILQEAKFSTKTTF
jgi:hypothetical protein